MSQTSEKSKKTNRKARSGQFVALKDGRKVYSPPSGGKFSKREIRTAVQAAIAERVSGK